ncbi:hypothetical protein M758_2G044000 [Ceratodon purpureus]|nr:hypothetical protein M758_2G044000 [Ceratodon purpureus]
MAAQVHAVCANIHSPCCSYSGPAGCRSTTVTSGGAALRDSVKSLQCSRASSSFSSCIRRHRQSGLFPPRRIAERIVLRRSVENSVEVDSEEIVDSFDESLVRMRELVDLAGGTSKGVDDASLMRFLKGLSLNVDEAAKAFAKHQQWETSFKPKGFISEVEIANELNAKKSYLQGRDKQGRPICVILARNHTANKEDFDEFRRFIVYSMDKILTAASDSTDGKINCIIDLEGLGFKNLDSKAFIAGFDMYQSHYPERIEKFYMVNAPLIFNGLWKVVRSFINETTSKKIVFVDKKKAQETLLSVIDADQLPKEYGGTADLVLLQDAFVPGWPPAKQEFSSLD